MAEQSEERHFLNKSVFSRESDENFGALFAFLFLLISFCCLAKKFVQTAWCLSKMADF